MLIETDYRFGDNRRHSERTARRPPLGRAMAWVAGLALCAGILLQLTGHPAGSGAISGPLDLILPAPLDGWRAESVPLGADAKAAEVLRFTAYSHREYSRNGVKFTVYIAYWAPGCMPVRVVGNHTPDGCWSNSGWKCERINETLTLGDQYLLEHGESRVFSSPSGKIVNVVFWHFVDGKKFADYGSRYRSLDAASEMWRSVVYAFFRGPREQYFVRLSSEMPLEALRAERQFVDLVAHISRMIQH